jgi:hypothetical protein
MMDEFSGSQHSLVHHTSTLDSQPIGLSQPPQAVPVYSAALLFKARSSTFEQGCGHINPLA